MPNENNITPEARQSAGLSVATGSAVWLLFGGYDHEGEEIIACCATEAEAEALKQYGLENKTDYGGTKYGYDSLRVCCWKVGDRGHGVPTLPNK